MPKIVRWQNRPFSESAPGVLFTAARAPALAYFTENNPWAANLPLVKFGTKGTPILAARHGGIHSVEGFAGPLEVYEGEDTQGQFLHIAKVAAHIASKAPGPVWEVCAGASCGFLAIGAATTGKRVLALSEDQPSAASMVMADLCEVDLDCVVPSDPPTA